eukprot:SAG31_NODE_1638_length_7672_cov_4.225142_1_plen_86_part_00
MTRIERAPRCAIYFIYMSYKYIIGVRASYTRLGTVIPRSPPWYQYWDPIGGLPKVAVVYTALKTASGVKFKLSLVTGTAGIRYSR